MGSGLECLAFLNFTLRWALSRESSQTVSQMTHTPVAEACPSDNSLTHETCILLRSEVTNRRQTTAVAAGQGCPTSLAERFKNPSNPMKFAPVLQQGFRFIRFRRPVFIRKPLVGW